MALNSRQIDLLVGMHFMGLPDGHFPHYSTDIKAAWDVWERLRQSGDFCCMEIRSPISEPWEVALTEAGYAKSEDGHLAIITTAETAPLAICLAALKAKGIEVSSD